jgi:hypothetical protein
MRERRRERRAAGDGGLMEDGSIRTWYIYSVWFVMWLAALIVGYVLLVVR